MTGCLHSSHSTAISRLDPGPFLPSSLLGLASPRLSRRHNRRFLFLSCPTVPRSGDNSSRRDQFQLTASSLVFAEHRRWSRGLAAKESSPRRKKRRKKKQRDRGEGGKKIRPPFASTRRRTPSFSKFLQSTESTFGQLYNVTVSGPSLSSMYHVRDFS